MASTYFTRTPSTTNRRTFTWSLWFKRAEIGSGNECLVGVGTSGNEGGAHLLSDVLEVYNYNSGYSIQLVTTQVFRDPSAWYHLVLAFDTTQATSSNRVKIYVNGSQVTSFSTANYGSQNLDTNVNYSSYDMLIGRILNSSSYFSGSYASVYFIDGQQLDASSFGETDATTGIWKPKSYAGSYGTNGFFLKFANSASLGTDSSGNGNNFTVGGGTPTQTLDTPSNVFCALNPLITPTSGSAGGLSNGNLTITAVRQNCGTFFLDKNSTGKWYWECKVISGADSSLDVAFGFSSDKNIRNDGSSSWAVTNTLWLYSSNGSKFTGSWTSSAGATFTNGDIIGMALDLNGDTITFYKNGVSQFTISSLTIDGTVITPWIQNTVTGCVVSTNFGNGVFGTTAISSPYSDGAGLGKFQYSVPTGYYALCTKNINVYG